MRIVGVTAHDALMDRADRAIADAIAARAEVQAGLIAAGRRRPCRPWADDRRFTKAPPVDPLPQADLVEPWWPLVRILAPWLSAAPAQNEELERSWRRALLTIETPLNLFRD